MHRIAVVDVVVEDAKVEIAAYGATGARGEAKDGGGKEKAPETKMATRRGNHRGELPKSM